MEENIRTQLLLFDGQVDLTSLEVQTWRSVMFSMVGANKVYVEKLKETAQVLKMYGEVCRHCDKTGNNSKPAADRVYNILTKICNFHNDVFGDYRKYTDKEGPFGDLIKSNDDEFQFIKRSADSYLKEHEKMEKKSAKAWKYYTRRVKKRDKLELKLSKTLTSDAIQTHWKLLSFRRKVGTALCKYNDASDAEVHHRECLAEQTESLRKQYLKDEKSKLDTMFSFISDLLGRMQKLTPQGLDDTDDLDFEHQMPKTKAMSKAGWEAYLKEYIFPERKCIQETRTATYDYEDDNEEFEDEDSEDEDSEDEDSEDEDIDEVPRCRGGQKQIRVQSLKAPRLNHDESGMNEVLKEIMDSLDNEPCFSKLRAESTSQRQDDVSINEVPETIKKRSRESSPVHRRRRSHDSSPVSRSRKSVKAVPENMTNESSHRSRFCEPNDETTVQDLTGEAHDPSSSRRKSLQRESLKRHSPVDDRPAPRSKSNNEARLRRRKAADENQVVLQDFNAQVESDHPPIHASNQWVATARGYPAADVGTEDVKRGQSNNDTREQIESQVRASEPSRGYPARAVSPHEVKRRHRTDSVSNNDRANTESEVRISGRHKEPDDNTGIMSESRKRRRAVKESNEKPTTTFADRKPSAYRDNKPSASSVNKSSDVGVLSCHDVSKDHQSQNRSQDRKASKYDLKEPKKAKQNENTGVPLPYKDLAHVCWKTDTIVYALQDWKKQKSNQISLRQGMKIKQTKSTDLNGMAYGYKKTKLGLKKYGFYPAFLVGLQPPHAPL